MTQMSGYSVKDYAKEYKKMYSNALNRLQSKYEMMSGAIDEEYISNSSAINNNAKRAKNNVSASHRVDLANSRAVLMDKGLERSGESVNTEIRSNLSKNQAFAAIDAEAEKSRRENALSRSRAKSELISKRLDEEGALERDMAEGMLDQANSDREYELKEKKYLSDEEEREFDNQMREKQYASDEEQRKFDNQMKEKSFALEEKKFAADEEDREFDNIMDVRRLALEEEERKSEKNSSEEKKSSSSTNNGSSKSNDKETGGKTFPDYAADELVDKMYKYYNTIHSNKKYLDSAMESAIYVILNDTTLDPEYKRQVRVYATAMGYI